MTNGARGAGEAIRIMLVDDHQTMLWGLQKLIDGERPRMEVVASARNCADAIEAAARLVPHLILLDLDLAGTSSVDIIPQLLSNGVSSLLVLTGERKVDVLDRAVRGGARGILQKDASAEQVLKAIEKVHRGELWLDRDSLERIFVHAVSVHKPEPERDRHATLTTREYDIIAAIVEHSDSAYKKVAQHLFISEHTLRNHLSSVYHKLGVRTRLELYVYAVKHRLARPVEKNADPASPPQR